MLGCRDVVCMLLIPVRAIQIVICVGGDGHWLILIVAAEAVTHVCPRYAITLLAAKFNPIFDIIMPDVHQRPIIKCVHSIEYTPRRWWMRRCLRADRYHRYKLQHFQLVNSMCRWSEFSNRNGNSRPKIHCIVSNLEPSMFYDLWMKYSPPPTHTHDVHPVTHRCTLSTFSW